jgi:hypothetical protein
MVKTVNGFNLGQVEKAVTVKVMEAVGLAEAVRSVRRPRCFAENSHSLEEALKVERVDVMLRVHLTSHTAITKMSIPRDRRIIATIHSHASPHTRDCPSPPNRVPRGHDLRAPAPRQEELEELETKCDASSWKKAGCLVLSMSDSIDRKQLSFGPLLFASRPIRHSHATTAV